MILLVNSGGDAALPEWQAAFREFAPNLDVRSWHDPEVAADDVHYALVWSPEHGRLARYRNLRLILSSAAGVDHITADPAWPAHVGLVRMGAAETAQRMGEFVCLAALALLRDLPRITAAQASRRWDSFDPARCAWDVRAGVMGLGNLGRQAAAMLRGLGFPTSGWSRTPRTLEGIDCHAGPNALDGFIAATDLLVCLLPDTPETRGIIRAETLARLPPGAAVVNAGRGRHVVLPDLLAALDSGHLSGAVLDVFEEEPLSPEHPAWRNPKLMVTSHLASSAPRRARARYVAEAIAAFEQGRTPPNLFDPIRGY